MNTRNGGGGWIRTTEVTDNRFTVCPLWPLGNSSIFNLYFTSPYGKSWSWWTDSNPRPADYKSAALPTELHQHRFSVHRLSWRLYYYTTNKHACQVFFLFFSESKNSTFSPKFRGFSFFITRYYKDSQKNCEKCINGDLVFLVFFVPRPWGETLDFLAEKRYHSNNIRTKKMCILYGKDGLQCRWMKTSL